MLKEYRRALAGALSTFEVMWGSYFHAVDSEADHQYTNV